MTLHALFGNQCSTDGAHQTGIGCPGNLAADILFHCTEYRIILKRSALNHNIFTEGLYVIHTNDFCKNILYDRTAQSSHNIFRKLTISLCRHNAARHKNCTSAAKICRMPGHKGRLPDLFHRNMKC